MEAHSWLYQATPQTHCFVVWHYKSVRTQEENCEPPQDWLIFRCNFKLYKSKSRTKAKQIVKMLSDGVKRVSLCKVTKNLHWKPTQQGRSFYSESNIERKLDYNFEMHCSKKRYIFGDMSLYSDESKLEGLEAYKSKNIISESLLHCQVSSRLISARF